MLPGKYPAGNNQRGRHVLTVSAVKILVVKDGEIVERGQHEDLVKAGGTYTQLYETQFGKAPDDQEEEMDLTGYDTD